MKKSKGVPLHRISLEISDRIKSEIENWCACVALTGNTGSVADALAIRIVRAIDEGKSSLCLRHKSEKGK